MPREMRESNDGARARPIPRGGACGMTAAIIDTSVHFNYVNLLTPCFRTGPGCRLCRNRRETVSSSSDRPNSGRECLGGGEEGIAVRYVPDPTLSELYKPAELPIHRPVGKMGKGSVDHLQSINRLEILEPQLWINSLSRIGKSPGTECAKKFKPFYAESRSITSRPFPAPSR